MMLSTNTCIHKVSLNVLFVDFAKNKNKLYFGHRTTKKLFTLALNDTSRAPHLQHDMQDGRGCKCMPMEWGGERHNIVLIKKCVKEECDRLCWSEVTDDKKKSEGAGICRSSTAPLLLNHDGRYRSWKEWRLRAGARVTDRSIRRELGSQHGAWVVGWQAAIIQIISCTAVCSSTHRQILIGKRGCGVFKVSCTLSQRCVISLVLLSNCQYNSVCMQTSMTLQWAWT